jgi:hypothetical protein
MSGHTVTLHVYNSKFTIDDYIPHSYVTLQAPGREPLIIGYYPQVSNTSWPGTVRNDAITGIDPLGRAAQHPSDFSKTFHVSPAQYANMLAFADKAANNPGHYQLIGEPNKSNWLAVSGYQCTGFAREILSEGDIHPERWRTSISGTVRAVPAMLAEEYRNIPENQIKPYRSTPTDKQINEQIESIKNGIKQHDPKDPNFQRPQQQPNGAPPSALDKLENQIKNLYKPYADAGTYAAPDDLNTASLTTPTHIRPLGGYPVPTEAQWNDFSKPLRVYNQEDGTSKVYTFNSDGIPIREQQLDVNGVDITPKFAQNTSPQMNQSQEQSQQPRLTISFG